MRRDRIAEWILSLATPADRAASTVGDLLEEGSGFWRGVARTTASIVWDELRSAPLRLVGFGVLAWFILFALSGLGQFGGNIAARLLWRIGYVFDNHTGVELITEWLGTQIPLAAPTWATYWGGFLVGAIVVPFWAGMRYARDRAGHELASWIVLVLVWVPLSPMFKLPAGLIPGIQISVLLGLLWMRWRALPPSGPRQA